MREKPRLTGIIYQVMILFLISILAIGLLTYYSQSLVADSNVKKLTEKLAEEVAEEVKNALEIFPVKKVSDVLEMLQLQPLVSEKKGRKKKEKGIAADPFHNVEAFWGVKENPIKLRPVE